MNLARASGLARTADPARTSGPGERHLRRAIRARRERAAARDGATGEARSEDPRPYDDDWGWWIEGRIARLENGQTWLIRIAIGALVAEIIRIVSVTAGLGTP